MNQYPGRGDEDEELDIDDNELEEDALDADALLDEEDDLDDPVVELEDGEDEYLNDEPEEEEVIVVPEQYQAAPRAPEPVASIEEETARVLFQQEEAGDEDSVPRPGPFDSPGPFAAPARGRERSRAQPRSVPAFDRAESGSRQTAVFSVFKPESSSGSLVGAAAVAISIGLGLALVLKSFAYDPSLWQFITLTAGALLLAVGGLAAYWSWASLTLRYVVDRNSLSIRWGAQKQVVPLVNIERLIPADPEGEQPDVQGVDWPGHHVGRARVQQLGEVLFYSGHRRMADVLYVQTATHTYAISVPDPVAFAETIQANQVRGPLFDQRQTVQRDGIAAQSFWLDPQARVLTFVLIASFLMVAGYVLQMYPGLAQSVPLRYPALGGLLNVTDKSELLDIPRSAGVFLGLNLLLAIVLHPWERMVSIVLLLAGIAIQIALLVAAIVAVA